MDGVLVRIGIDSTKKYGGWNGPVDTDSNEFVYVPLRVRDKTRKRYDEVMGFLGCFCNKHGVDLYRDLGFPSSLEKEHAHLDPDFDYLTYGDDGANRGKKILGLDEGDLIAFYGGLKPVKNCEHKTFYALMGLYVVDHWMRARDVPPDRSNENAHTRRQDTYKNDVVVWEKKGESGRLNYCIPIGEWRNGAYRVKENILNEWGGLCVKDGYIQRSGSIPRFKNPERFYTWFNEKDPILLQQNNVFY